MKQHKIFYRDKVFIVTTPELWVMRALALLGLDFLFY